MARRVKVPCEYCEETWGSDYKIHRNGYCLWVEFYPYNNIMAAIAQANDEDGEMIEDAINIPMNFCPNCGRDLREGKI